MLISHQLFIIIVLCSLVFMSAAMTDRLLDKWTDRETSILKKGSVQLYLRKV